jgi:type II secretion system protein I
MSRHTASESPATAGFSLVEVLCALAIASMAMVALLRGVGTSQLSTNRLESHIGARVILQSILEDELAAAETTAAHREGKSGPYVWRLDIEPMVAEIPRRLPPANQFYRLSAEVTWQPRGSLSASTLKLGK